MYLVRSDQQINKSSLKIGITQMPAVDRVKRVAWHAFDFGDSYSQGRGRRLSPRILDIEQQSSHSEVASALARVEGRSQLNTSQGVGGAIELRPPMAFSELFRYGPKKGARFYFGSNPRV